MSKSIDCVALITARGGSKRLPRKNVRLLGGKPLIVWTVEAALAAKNVRDVIVSTDDHEIASVASEAGARVPFLRPPEISGDLAPHREVVAHALNWLEHEAHSLPKFLCILQPTSPFRTSEDIDAVIELAVSRDADAAISVAQTPVHPSYLYRVDQESHAQLFLPRGDDTYFRSQDLEPLYYVNGGVYVLRPDTFRERSAMLPENPLAYVMPAERSADIDDALDFELAEQYVARLCAKDNS
jgi:CMP-N-acetylneuraminic acid synthetase